MTQNVFAFHKNKIDWFHRKNVNKINKMILFASLFNMYAFKLNRKLLFHSLILNFENLGVTYASFLQ